MSSTAVVIAFDCDDEGGEVAKLPFGFEHASGGPAERHLARRSNTDC